MRRHCVRISGAHLFSTCKSDNAKKTQFPFLLDSANAKIRKHKNMLQLFIQIRQRKNKFPCLFETENAKNRKRENLLQPFIQFRQRKSKLLSLFESENAKIRKHEKTYLLFRASRNHWPWQVVRVHVLLKFCHCLPYDIRIFEYI